MSTPASTHDSIAGDDGGPYTIAVLPLVGTTVTATAVPSTTGLAVVDGTTISFRAQGITLPDGQVFSLGFDGLVASTTTGTYRAVSLLETTPSVRYDSTRHPTSAIIATNGGDESAWSVDVSPTESATQSLAGVRGTTSMTLTSSGRQVSTLDSASPTTGSATGSITTGQSGTSVATQSGATASPSTGGSSGSYQEEMSNVGGLFMLLLCLLGLFRL